VDLTVQVQGSDGAVVTFTQRLVKGSDLSQTATDLSLDNIPMPTGITDSNGSAYTNFTAFVDDFGNIPALQGTRGPRGYIPDSVTVNENVSGDFFLTFNYPESYSFDSSTFSVAAGVDGTNGTDGRGIASIVLGNHPTDSSLYRLTFTYDDQASTSVTTDFAKPVDGTTPKEISSASLGTDTNNSANYALTFTYDDASTDTVTFAKPVDGTTPKEISSASLGTDANNSANYALTITYDDASTDIVTFVKPTDGTNGTDGKSVSSISLGTDANNSANYALTFTYNDSTTDSVTFAKPLDGSGAVDSVNGNSPDANGNVTLSIPVSGTDFDPAGTALQLAIALG